MKKRILSLIFAFCMFIPCAFFFCACDDILDIAYVEFRVTGEQVVNYQAYQSTRPQIYLYENQEEYDKEFSVELLTILFKRGGLDITVNGTPKAICEIEGDYYMIVWISKDYYDVNKHIYLNGKKLDYIEDESFIDKSATLYYENFGFVKGNTTDFINIIEYK